MKKRNGFVSNSSSSSFILAFPHGDEGDKQFDATVNYAREHQSYHGSLEEVRPLSPMWLDDQYSYACVDTVNFLHDNGYQCTEFTIDNHDVGLLDFFMDVCSQNDYYQVACGLEQELKQ